MGMLWTVLKGLFALDPAEQEEEVTTITSVDMDKAVVLSVTLSWTAIRPWHSPHAHAARHQDRHRNPIVLASTPSMLAMAMVMVMAT